MTEQTRARSSNFRRKDGDETSACHQVAGLVRGIPVHDPRHHRHHRRRGGALCLPRVPPQDPLPASGRRPPGPPRVRPVGAARPCYEPYGGGRQQQRQGPRHLLRRRAAAAVRQYAASGAVGGGLRRAEEQHPAAALRGGVLGGAAGRGGEGEDGRGP